MKHLDNVVAICLSAALERYCDNWDTEDSEGIATAFAELTLKPQKYEMSHSFHFKVMSIVGQHYTFQTTNAGLDGTAMYKIIWTPAFDDYLDSVILLYPEDDESEEYQNNKYPY